MGDYEDLAALKADDRERLERNALDRARHEFADKMPIEYAGRQRDASGCPRS